MDQDEPQALPIRAKEAQAENGDGPIVQKKPKGGMIHRDYTVGWICALPIEMAAAKAMLDNIHQILPRKEDDSNNYVFGDIADHNIAIACLPEGHYGTNNAATVANNMRRSFPAIDRGLVVGIGGGVPETTDVRLGDIIVGNEVVQYDCGKTLPNGLFHRTGHPIRPPQILMTAVSKLRADHDMEPSKVPAILSEMYKRYPSMTRYTHPSCSDRLFHRTYRHDSLATDCERCDESELLNRRRRENSNPKVHYGRIASGNQVIKDGETRARLAKELDIICFEMEAAGLMDNFPCLIIRGICDYSDSHKNKEWQKYAAATAAAYAKELLQTMPMDMSAKTSGAVPNNGIIPNTAPEIPDRTVEIREYLMASLIYDQIHVRYDSIRSAHSRTCKWILEHPEYILWLTENIPVSHHGVLWINGKPGAGKSTLMKFCYQDVYGNRREEPNTAVVPFFFNARGVDLEKSTNGMYQCLLLEIFRKFPDLQKLLDRFKDLPQARAGQMSWDIEKLESIFSDVIQNLGRRKLVCFIDALDECPESEVRDMVAFFEQLGEQASRNATYLRICLSSRHYPHIFLSNGLELTLEDQKGHGEDIERYIRSKLRAGKNKVVEDIVEKIIYKSAGVFMWVVLVVGILNKDLQRGRIFAVQSKLQQLPAELSKLFQTIIARDNENMEDLLLCIQWVLYAKKPLKSHEFYFALVSGLDPSPENIGGWNPQLISMQDMKLFVLSSSKGLAEITKFPDPSIQFIHESVSDFLIKDNGVRDLWPEHAESFESLGHNHLKECCSNYIEVNMPEALSMKARFSMTTTMDATHLRERLRRKFPLLEYAVHHVLHHANASESGLSQDNYIRNFNLQSWLKLHNLFERNESRHHGAETSFMYIFAEQNLGNLARSFMRNGSNIHQVERELHGYPIFAALAKGHKRFLSVLFPKDQCPKESVFDKLEYEEKIWTRQRMNPLHWSAKFGYVEIFDAVLSSTVIDVNFGDAQDQTPLDLAVASGHSAIVKLILEAGVVCIDADRLRELLTWPTRLGDAEVVRLLLTIPTLEIEVKQELGSEMLLLAAANGHERTLLLLVAMGGLNVNQRDADGRTSLWWAAYSGHAEVLKLLLTYEHIDPGLGDKNGMTPLFPAVKNGHETIISLLLSSQKIDPGMTDKYGRTALSYASELGHTSIMTVLLKNEAVDSGLRDRKGMTPLVYAARKGQEAAVKLLLPLMESDVGLRDNKGRTALYHAARNGHEAVIKLLTRHISGELSVALVPGTPRENGNENTMVLQCEHIKEDWLCRI